MASEDLSGLSVLLVDDENFSRRLVSGMLADFGRPTVLEAENGAAALNVLADHKVDLIISDFNMPELHGLQLLRAVRTGASNVNRAIPFAMLTGYSEKTLVDQALALDANAFLIKPVSQAALKTRLIKMLSFVEAGNWLKDGAVYEAIDVDDILDQIAGNTTADRDVMPDDQPLFRAGPVAGPGTGPGQAERGEISAAFEREEFGKTAKASSPDDQIGERSCPLNELPADAFITRDVFTADGSLFMHAGTQLTPLMISILVDLQDLGHPVDNIRISA